MNGINYTRVATFVTFIYLLSNDMTSKFIAGFITGIFVSTKYDFKPYVSLIEDKISSLQKELETKRDEINHQSTQSTQPTQYSNQKTQEEKSLIDNSWGFNWPWSKGDKKN